MSAVRALATAGSRAHRGSMLGTGAVLAAAGAVLTMTGVLIESGLRAGLDGPQGGVLLAIASSFAGTALVLVLLVVTSTVTLAMRQRREEFALLRTIGATASQVRELVSLETLRVALVAVPLGALPGMAAVWLMGPLLVDARLVAPGFRPSFSPGPALASVALLAGTAVLAGRLAARESSRSSRSSALRASAAEGADIGGTRRIAAVVLAVTGLCAALTPTVVPGVVGAASAASSTFLLIGAAAAAGPLLVHAALARAARLSGSRRSATTRLATANARGFSRRLTTVVVPLALVVATGTIQTTVERGMARAANDQLAEAIGADLVVVAPSGLGDAEVDQMTAGRSMASAPLGSAVAQLHVDEDLPDALGWQSVALRVVPPHVPRSLLDPEVSAGALESLDATDTIALSSDAAFEMGAGVGDSVGLRLGADQAWVTVVAVYDRGLGLGDHLVGPATTAAHGLDVHADTVLVTPRPNEGDLRSAAPDGAHVLTARSYVDEVVSPDAAAQRVSTVLLLALLLFVGLGSVNTVGLATAGRRRELGLLARTGATRRQLLRMVATEGLLTGALAWLLGTVVTLPAAVAVAVALLGTPVAPVDLAVHGAMTAAVLVIAAGVSVATAAAITRPSRSRAARRQRVTVSALSRA